MWKLSLHFTQLWAAHTHWLVIKKKKKSIDQLTIAHQQWDNLTEDNRKMTGWQRCRIFEHHSIFGHCLTQQLAQVSNFMLSSFWMVITMKHYIRPRVCCAVCSLNCCSLSAFAAFVPGIWKWHQWKALEEMWHTYLYLNPNILGHLTFLTLISDFVWVFPGISTHIMNITTSYEQFPLKSTFNIRCSVLQNNWSLLKHLMCSKICCRRKKTAETKVELKLSLSSCTEAVSTMCMKSKEKTHSTNV